MRLYHTGGCTAPGRPRTSGMFATIVVLVPEAPGGAVAGIRKVDVSTVGRVRLDGAFATEIVRVPEAPRIRVAAELIVVVRAGAGGPRAGRGHGRGEQDHAREQYLFHGHTPVQATIFFGQPRRQAAK